MSMWNMIEVENRLNSSGFVRSFRIFIYFTYLLSIPLYEYASIQVDNRMITL
jgi:hypothetical protein